MKTLKQILQLEVYEPKSPDEKRFKDKHVTVKHKDANGNDDDLFNAKNIKTIDRQPRHGYNPGEDEKVYEATMTPKLKKKREEVAKALEREHPGWSMEKKMAIATASAKKALNLESTQPKVYTGTGQPAGAGYHVVVKQPHPKHGHQIMFTTNVMNDKIKKDIFQKWDPNKYMIIHTKE